MNKHHQLREVQRLLTSRRTFIGSGVSAATYGFARLGFPQLLPAKALADGSPPGKTLSILEFGVTKNDRSDTTPAVRSALERCKSAKIDKLVFPQGTYHFWPSRASEAYVYASNNDASMKRIAFPIFDIDDLEIDGEGSNFIFHGKINPFVIRDSRGVKLANFSIDWERPFHNEGKVLSVNSDGICVEFGKEFPFRIEKSVLYFLGEDNQSCGIRGRDPCPIGNLLEFDSKRRETAYMARDYYNLPFAQAVSIGSNSVCLKEPKFDATVGNVVVFGEPSRYYSAFSISSCANVELSQVTIHHAGGMGVIAQQSFDLFLNQVRVTPSNGRVISVTADATHFVNCRGKIVISDCLFENQLDDASNIHGIYGQIARRITSRKIEVRLVHPQQRGIQFIAKGDRVEMLHPDDLITYDERDVAAINFLNDEYFELEFDSPVPQELRIADVVGNVTAFPDVTVQGCDIGRNRARGLLLGSRGKIIIENNRFHTPGSALLMEGDARYWFEQAGVRDLTIQHNQFVDCNYGVWGKATIEVAAGINPSKRSISRYNRNILIKDNEFHIFDQGPLLSMYSVDGLTVRSNLIKRDNSYPPARPLGELYDISDSDNVHIQ